MPYSVLLFLCTEVFESDRGLPRLDFRFLNSRKVQLLRKFEYRLNLIFSVLFRCTRQCILFRFFFVHLLFRCRHRDQISFSCTFLGLGAPNSVPFPVFRASEMKIWPADTTKEAWSGVEWKGKLELSHAAPHSWQQSTWFRCRWQPNFLLASALFMMIHWPAFFSSRKESVLIRFLDATRVQFFLTHQCLIESRLSRVFRSRCARADVSSLGAPV